MKSLGTLTDPTYNPKETLSWYDKLWLKVIIDKRDLPFIYLLTRIHLVVVIPAIIFFTPLLQGWIWWAAAVPYFYISQFYFKGRYGLMFHCICHRKAFKKEFSWIHSYITWIVGPLFGHAPEGYFSHHMGMHHVENNMEEDTSSTMKYQRDSFPQFMRYFTKFILVGVKNTFIYLYDRKRKKLYQRLTIGEGVFYVFCVLMCIFVNLKATLLVYVVPFFFARFVMMLGNWTQHSFVDHDEPDNLYKSSINCINTKYNQICWNDGYHIIHHLRPGLHYTEMPGEFLKRKDDFAKNKAIVFDGIHYLHIFTWLMTKNYDKLADNLVNINGMFNSREEAIALMKARTKKIA